MVIEHLEGPEVGQPGDDAYTRDIERVLTRVLMRKVRRELNHIQRISVNSSKRLRVFLQTSRTSYSDMVELRTSLLLYGEGRHH